jgi:glycosyltransferase involved in cell wall biosynthesis
MHVAHFIQRYPPALGGSEAYFARLSQFFAARGHQVSVHTTTALDLEAFWSPRGRCLAPGTTTTDGVTVRRYPLARWPGRRYLLKLLSLVPVRPWQCLTLPCNPISPAMWREARQNPLHFNLVHAAAFPYAWPIVCGLWLARLQGIPFLLTPFLHLGDVQDVHNRTRRDYLSPALAYLLRAADRIFVQTQLERAAVQELQIEPGKIVLQGLGVAGEECTGGNRARARHDWGMTEDVRVIGHLANNSEEKGSADLLRAAERAWASGCSFHVVLAGPEMSNFSRFWQKFGGKDRVRRLGILSDGQKKDFYSGLDVFALPSHSDSFGLVLLEAWANGLPNVVYRAGGPAELVRDGEDGLLADAGDISGLADCLRCLVEDRDRSRRMGLAGRARAEHEFRWQDKLEIVSRTYDEVAAGRAK